jgi:hypothetical protein
VPNLHESVQLLAICGGVMAAMKVGWAIAEFFIGLAQGLKNLTTAVTALTERFDAHTGLITEDISDLRERVVKLETHYENRS